MRRPASHPSRGYSLVELLCVATLMATLLGGIYELSAQSLRVSLSSREAMLASGVLSERLETLRRAPWDLVTQRAAYQDDSWIDEDGEPQTFTGLLSAAPQAGGVLPGLIETVTISEYPPPSGNPPAIKITRAGSSVVTDTSSVDLTEVQRVRVDVKVSWSRGFGKQARSQEISAIFSKEEL